MAIQFDRRCAEVLSAHFGPLGSLVEPKAVDYPGMKDKVARTGHAVYEINELAMCMFGHTSRALYHCGLTCRVVLLRAYGDAGCAVVAAGNESSRWRAVAPLTPEAYRRGAQWRAKSKDPSPGPAALAYWRHVEAIGACDEQVAIKAHAISMLASAEQAFADSLAALELVQEQIRRAAR